MWLALCFVLHTLFPLQQLCKILTTIVVSRKKQWHVGNLSRLPQAQVPSQGPIAALLSVRTGVLRGPSSRGSTQGRLKLKNFGSIEEKAWRRSWNCLTQNGNCTHWGRTYQFSSVHFSRSVVSDSLRPHEPQHARPPCPSPTPGIHSDSRPSSQWCHLAISSSVVPFFSCPQSLPASKSFPMVSLKIYIFLLLGKH